MKLAHTPITQFQRGNAKRMRKEMTPAEAKLWQELRAHRLMGLGFRRQFPIRSYIVDFACPSHRLAVELDGSQHGQTQNALADHKRTSVLEADGWTVLRFWNDDVLKGVDHVCHHIVTIAGLNKPETPES